MGNLSQSTLVLEILVTFVYVFDQKMKIFSGEWAQLRTEAHPVSGYIVIKLGNLN